MGGGEGKALEINNYKEENKPGRKRADELVCVVLSKLAEKLLSYRPSLPIILTLCYLPPATCPRLPSLAGLALDDDLDKNASPGS